MTKRISIADVDKVTRPSKSKGSGKTFEPSQGGGTSSNDDMMPQPNMPETPQTPRKPKPGRRTLSDAEKLEDDFVERITEQLKNDDWDIGGIPPRPGKEGTGGYPGQPKEGPEPPGIGEPIELPPGGDSRIWVDIDTLSKEMDEANRQGEENSRIQDANDEEKKAQKTDTEKTIGGGGSGRGRIRDRIAVERLSETDWSAIFKSRLTEYSRENAKYQPWNRRFVSNKTLRPTIGSKTPKKDVLPELNLLVDTSSSISFAESAVILGEIEKAMASAKIKTLNVFLWHDAPYEYKSWKDVTSKNLHQVIDWINSNWRDGGNKEALLYEEIVKKGKAKKFTISITDAYLSDHMQDGPIKNAWTKALDPSNTIFAIIYPNRAISYDNWLKLANRMPGQKVPVFLDTTKFRNK